MTFQSPAVDARRGSEAAARPRRPVLFLLLFGLLAVTPLLFMWIGESLSAHRCVEAGGSFDYERMVCDFDEAHPVPPFHERHRALLVATAIALPAAAALWWWGPRLGRPAEGTGPRG